MTEEQINLLVQAQMKKIKKQLMTTMKNEGLTSEQKIKKVKKFTRDFNSTICLAIEGYDEKALKDAENEDLVQNDADIETKTMAEEKAIDVSNLWINYKTIHSYSIKKMLLRGKKNNDDLFSAVRGVSFSINKGEIWGIIGKNGSGKSTMLRAIAGIFSPDQGSVDLHGNSISLLSIGVGFKKELTGRENIMLSGMLLGFSEELVREKMDEIIEFSELEAFIDYPVRTYSSGMYSKLAFSITSSLETDIILIDEVLSVGDEKFRKKSMQRMKDLINNDDRTVVIVSHSITTLNQLCNKMIWLHEGKIKMMGPTKEVLLSYKEFMK